MSVLHRKPVQPVVEENPNPIKNYDASVDEHGKIVYVQVDPVAPSLAEDYSVLECALINHSSKVSPVRISTDIVDLERKF